MQNCTSLQTDNHASIPPLSFLQAGCPSCHPTNSIKVLKANNSTDKIREYSAKPIQQIKEQLHLQMVFSNKYSINTNTKSANSKPDHQGTSLILYNTTSQHHILRQHCPNGSPRAASGSLNLPIWPASACR